MRYRLVVLLPAFWLAAVATAQTVPAPPAADHLRLTLPPGMTQHPTDKITAESGATRAIHFRFDAGKRNRLLQRPPPRPMDRAVVMGGQRPWLGGKPPVNCAFTPMDPLCR
ncbi:MAG: hypothetical protein EPN74_13380 [Rhodanobacter sp.]|nr:MAG: hypothetical protein EPN74_13380 [Rhodanobacter sp.]